MTALTPATRVALEDLYERFGFPGAHRDWVPQYDAPLAEIVQSHGVPPEDAAAYLKRLALLWGSFPSHTVTLFVYEKSWVARKPCVGLRGGWLFLPRETYTIGFIAHSQALLKAPPMETEEMHDQLRQKVVEALLRAGDIGAEKKADILLAQGYVEIKRYGGLPKHFRSS